jgi:peptide deformylase
MIELSKVLLNRISDPVEKADNLALLFDRLETELTNSETPGVGLAAVQIGVLKRAAIVRVKDTKLNLWNPEIIKASDFVVHSEGCLSLPGLTKSVQRATEVVVKNGDDKEYALSGLEAIVVQHELDHLYGITIADKEYRSVKIGRNTLCPCGSKKKFKKCCLGKENEADFRG